MSKEVEGLYCKLRANETEAKIAKLRKDAEAVGYSIVKTADLEALRLAAALGRPRKAAQKPAG